MKDPVSVIITLYNKPTVVQRAIRSVLAQTYTNFELIVVNDGSTDESFQKAQDFRDPRMRFFQQENRGVANARNRGVAEAKYEWVAFLDADDEWLPDFLEKITALSEKFPCCGLYGCAHYRVTKNLLLVSTPISDLPYAWEGILENYFDYTKDIIPFNSSSVFISKKCFEAVGGFPDGIKMWEDADTWMRLSIFTRSAFLNIPLTIYHLEAENRSWLLDNDEKMKVLVRWKELEASGSIPEELVPSFQEYQTRYRVMVARAYLLKGQPKIAKQVLSEIIRPGRYNEAVRKLQRWAKFPILLSRTALYLRRSSLFVGVMIGKFLGIEN